MMHEFHAWVGLSDSTEEDDLAKVRVVVDDLRAMVEESSWHDASFEVKNLNGQYFFMADGFVNRRRDEGERLDLFLDAISRRLPGSWGLVYERDDEMPDPPGPNGFRVRMLARGKIFERADPFLSPCNPVIEDLSAATFSLSRGQTGQIRVACQAIASGALSSAENILGRREGVSRNG